VGRAQGGYEATTAWNAAAGERPCGAAAVVAMRHGGSSGRRVEKGEKGNTPVFRSRLYSSVRWAHTVRPAPPIFVGEATSPTNIGPVYSFVTCVTNEYMSPIKVKLDDSYIHRSPIKTDEYKFIFISFGTDEFKNPDE
jgi:hypothetical protein